MSELSCRSCRVGAAVSEAAGLGGSFASALRVVTASNLLITEMPAANAEMIGGRRTHKERGCCAAGRGGGPDVPNFRELFQPGRARAVALKQWLIGPGRWLACACRPGRSA
jgi:hypothetical protein